jgi:hypothetical protein
MFMRKMIPFALAAAIPLAGDAEPFRKLEAVEQAVEMTAFEVRLDDQDRAQITAKPCDQCAVVTLEIDASTQLTRAREALPLRALNEQPVQGATLYYLPASGRVTRIALWR